MFYSIPYFLLTFCEIIGISLNTTFHFKSLQRTDGAFIILPGSFFSCNPIISQPNKFVISPVLRNFKYTIDIVAVSLTEVIMPQMRVSIKEVVP